MNDIYSVYDAKARFSEVIRKVREGKTVMVSYRGETVAEIRPIEPADNDLDRHLRVLEGLGVVIPPSTDRPELATVAERPGALARFLRDREG